MSCESRKQLTQGRQSCIGSNHGFIAQCKSSRVAGDSASMQTHFLGRNAFCTSTLFRMRDRSLLPILG